MKKTFWIVMLIAFAASLQLGMAHRGEYDEEAREQERLEKEERKANKEHRSAAKEFASGLKQTTVDNATDLVSDTAQPSDTGDPVTGTLENARLGTGKVLDNTVKGAVKVATLGYGHVDHYEVQEPEKGSDEPTKIKIKIPGT